MRVLIIFLLRRPFLESMEAPREIGEEAVNAHLVYPVLVLRVRILKEIEVQELVLIPECVGVNLRDERRSVNRSSIDNRRSRTTAVTTRVKLNVDRLIDLRLITEDHEQLQ